MTTSYKNAINASDIINISYSLQQDKTIFDINIRLDEPLQTFSFTFFQKDGFKSDCFACMTNWCQNHRKTCVEALGLCFSFCTLAGFLGCPPNNVCPT